MPSVSLCLHTDTRVKLYIIPPRGLSTNDKNQIYIIDSCILEIKASDQTINQL